MSGQALHRERSISGLCPGHPRPSRLLILSQPTTEGVAVCVRDQVDAAVRSGCHVTVACPQAGDLAAWAIERGAEWERVEMRRSPHLSDFAAVAKVRRLTLSHDLVLLHSSKAGAVGRVALASLGRRRPPSVFTPHGWSWLVGGRLSALYRLTERILLPVTTFVVAVSGEERSAGRAALGARASRIRVIPNGVDVTRFSPDGTVAARADDPLVVSVGRLSHQRGPDVAVAALALMRTPGTRLRLVGDGEDRAKIAHQASELGLAQRVELIGFRPDPAPELRAADVVIVPSRYDGMALVLLEAMACGAAIVATRVAGCSALDAAGILVPIEEPALLAKAVDELLADTVRRTQLGKAARRRAVERYSVQRSQSDTVALWQETGVLPAMASRGINMSVGGNK
ncbi:MAG TPA: glycosyltransferase [Streptosporangiaceae bacterium]|nr:glycosyltransferase [Streptosporangiaceae bacterium]